MTTHTITIENPPECPTFDLIRTGVKTVEGRKFSLKHQKYKVGDTLVFTCGERSAAATITYLHAYRSLEDYLKTEGIHTALPGIRDFESAVKLYNTFSTPLERAKLKERFGYSFLGIGVKVQRSK